MKKSLEERLKRYPELQERFEAMLDIVENVDGKIIKADDAEERLVEEVQKSGNQALTSWAETLEAQVSREQSEKKGIVRDGKKI